MVNYRVKLFGGWLWLWCNICEINKWLAPALSEHVWAVWKHNGSHLVPAAGQREGRKCSHRSKRGTKISTKGECESNLSCVKKVFFKYSNDLHLATSFCNSSDCKSWWLQPDTCFFSQIFGASLSFRLICFVSADHRAAYLPVGRAGQRSGQRSRQAAAAVDSRAQRSTELLKTAGAGEPSWLADAPVLCRAVKRRWRKEGGRERRSGRTVWHRKQRAQIVEMERCEPNTSWKETISCRRQNITWIFTMCNKFRRRNFGEKSWKSRQLLVF